MSPEFGYRFSQKFAIGMLFSYENVKGKDVSSPLYGSGSDYVSLINSNSYSCSPFLQWNFRLIDNLSFSLRFVPGMALGNDRQKILYNEIENSSVKNKWYSYSVSADPGFEYTFRNRFAFMLDLGSVGFSHTWNSPYSYGSGYHSVSNNFISTVGLNGLSIGMIIYFSKSGSSQI
jgi:hypothetical protein